MRSFLDFGLCAALFLASCDGPTRAATNEDSQPKAAPLVRVAPIETRSVQREIESTAWLESEHEVQVLAKVAGRIDEVLVDEGQRVTAGQVLARIDPREAKAALKQVEVQREASKVAHSLAEIEAETAGHRVEQAKIDLQQADAEFKRQEELGAEQVSSKVLDDARFARDSAANAVQVAELAARKAKLDAERAKNTIAELEARYEESNLRLQEHEIRAPFEGVVAERMITGGETISTATELFRVLDNHKLISYLQRPQSELPILRNAKRVVFTSDAYGDEEFAGDIDLISPVVDRETSSFKIRMRVRKDHVEKLRPGMFIRVRILTEEVREAMMVPKAALLTEGDKTIVFAVRDGRAHQIAIRPGLEQQDWIESMNGVDGGLVPGDVVIVSGQDDLKDQDKVEVTRD